MGCWMSFRGSLKIEPRISEEDKKAFEIFSKRMSYPENQEMNYANPWFVNDEGRLECMACKFGEYGMWMELLYDRFFDQRDYDVFGTLLISGEGRQSDWSVIRFDNGVEFHPHLVDDVHIDLDFWEMGARYAEQYRKEHPPEGVSSKSVPVTGQDD